MTSATMAMLDQEELFKLGLDASGKGDSGAAIAYLKEAVSRPDASANAHYVLGAEYAQIKLYDRAINQMEAAIALDPALSIARLQLGMLWLGANDPGRGSEVLAVLQSLGQQDPLRHFADGLLHLVRNEQAAALQALTQGMALNTSNPALNADMQRIIAQVEAAQPAAAGAMAAPGAEPEPEQGGQHVLLSAYTGHHA